MIISPNKNTDQTSLEEDKENYTSSPSRRIKFGSPLEGCAVTPFFLKCLIQGPEHNPQKVIQTLCSHTIQWQTAAESQFIDLAETIAKSKNIHLEKEFIYSITENPFPLQSKIFRVFGEALIEKNAPHAWDTLSQMPQCKEIARPLVVKALKFGAYSTCSILARHLTPQTPEGFGLRGLAEYQGAPPDIIEAVSAGDKNIYGREMFSRKILAHLWHRKGLTSVGGTSERLEGGISKGFIYFLRKIIPSIALTVPRNFQLDRLLISLFQQALEVGESSISKDKIVKKIHGQEICILPVGWKRHGFTLLFWKDCMIICNKGDREKGTPQIKAFKIDRSLFNIKTLDEIKKISNSNKEIGNPFFYSELPLLLNGTPSHQIQTSLERCWIGPQSQWVGNCAMENIFAALHTLSILEYCLNNDQTLDLDRVQFGYPTYKAVRQRIMLGCLEHYLEQHQRLSYKEKMDENLLGHIFDDRSHQWWYNSMIPKYHQLSRKYEDILKNRKTFEEFEDQFPKITV